MKKFLFLILAVFTVQIASAQTWALDSSFGTNGIVHTMVGYGSAKGHSVAIQSDGKIVMVGETGIAANLQAAVVRFNADGTLDSSFGDDGEVLIPQIGERDYLLDVAIQSDGKIVASGYTQVAGDIIVVRLNTDGTLDTSFDTDGIVVIDFEQVFNIGETVAIQSDGKILIGGDTNDDFMLARLNADGSLDNTFGIAGMAKTEFGTNPSFVKDITIQADGKIVASGFFINDLSQENFAVARYNTDGTPDVSFGTAGMKTIDSQSFHAYSEAVCIQSDGKILLGGHEWIDYGPKYDFTVVRLLADGSLDNTFGTDGVATARVVDGENYVNDMLVQDDGKIILAGRTVLGQDYNFAAARFNSDGSLDLSFTPTGMIDTDVSMEAYGEAALIQPDGKIVVAGRAYNSSTVSEFIMVRYSDGADISVAEISGSSLTIYPNPANDILKIETDSRCSIEVLDLSGKIVFSTIVENQSLVDVSNFASGMYFVRANSNSVNEVIQLIIE